MWKLETYITKFEFVALFRSRLLSWFWCMCLEYMRETAMSRVYMINIMCFLHCFPGWGPDRNGLLSERPDKSDLWSDRPILSCPLIRQFKQYLVLQAPCGLKVRYKTSSHQTTVRSKVTHASDQTRMHSKSPLIRPNCVGNCIWSVSGWANVSSMLHLNKLKCVQNSLSEHNFEHEQISQYCYNLFFS